MSNSRELTLEEREIVIKFSKLFFRAWNNYRRTWLGTHIVKYPTDLFIYQMIMYRNRPDFLIETGSYMGGGALFFASMFDLIGKGQVLSIDRRDLKGRPQHPRIRYIVGRSTEDSTLELIRELIGSKTCMAVLDSDHRRPHVKRELLFYSKFITKGQYLIVEDTFLDGHPIESNFGPGPLEAVQWFMERNSKRFVVDALEKQFLVSMNPGGFLRRL